MYTFFILNFRQSIAYVQVYFNSAIHKVAGSLVTGRSKKATWLEPPPEAVPPLTASRLEQWNDGIVPRKSWKGREPWGFVNSAVKQLLALNELSWFEPEIPFVQRVAVFAV